jgi:ABC-type dipeptide/oligopeptide/nickel transport system permease subunit
MGGMSLQEFSYGARVSLISSVLSCILGASIGMLLGLIAGYCEGVIGTLIMRYVDLQLAIPPFCLPLL